MAVNKHLAVGVPSALVAVGLALAPPAEAWIAMADSPWWTTACIGLRAATRLMPRRLLSLPAMEAARHAAFVISGRRAQCVPRCLPTPTGPNGTVAPGPPDPKPKQKHLPVPPNMGRTLLPPIAMETSARASR
jgi:hypothetical protein